MPALAVEKGKKYALEALAKRRIENTKRKRNKSVFFTDAPIYFYCKFCEGLADIVSSEIIVAKPKEVCEECQALKDRGWV